MNTQNDSGTDSPSPLAGLLAAPTVAPKAAAYVAARGELVAAEAEAARLGQLHAEQTAALAAVNAELSERSPVGEVRGPDGMPRKREHAERRRRILAGESVADLDSALAAAKLTREQIRNALAVIATAIRAHSHERVAGAPLPTARKAHAAARDALVSAMRTEAACVGCPPIAVRWHGGSATIGVAPIADLDREVAG